MKETQLQIQLPGVPKAKQGREIPPRWGWTEAAVWTERMLATLERGIKGGKCLFRRTRANLLSLNPSQSGQRSLRDPLTGEPDAGKPPVRFGGRGEVTTLAPTPIGGSIHIHWRIEALSKNESRKTAFCLPA